MKWGRKIEVDARGKRWVDSTSDNGKWLVAEGHNEEARLSGQAFTLHRLDLTRPGGWRGVGTFHTIAAAHTWAEVES